MKNLVFVLAVFCALDSSAQTKVDTSKLTLVLQHLLDTTHTPGFAIAVVKGNQVLYSRGFGYRDYEKKISVNSQTCFPIGSTSKAFTTAILGRLADESKLSFDDSPIKYIPELRFYNDELNNQVTIRDLAAHRTGVPRHDFSWYLFPTLNRDSMLQRIHFQEPFTDFRSKWYYNNFMFLTQGVIVERITAKTWEENIRELFFTPLKMSASTLSISELEKQANKSFGYVSDAKSTKKIDYFHIDAMSPAGSINSSVHDMSKWISMWLSGGKANGKQILSPEYIKEALSSQMIVSAAYPTKEFPETHFSNYGFAWFLSSYKGHYRAEHGGNIDGFTANVALFPSDSLGIVVLCNQDGSSLPTLARNIAADFFLDLQQSDWIQFYQEKNAALPKEEKVATEVKNNITQGATHPLSGYLGSYFHGAYGQFEILKSNDSLFAVFQRVKLYLKHKHYDIFVPFSVEKEGFDSTSYQQIVFNFYANESGEIEGVKLPLEPTLKPIQFVRTPKTFEVDQQTLKKLVGTYILSGTNLLVELVKNELILTVPGQPKYTLLPTAPSEFAIKGLSGYSIHFSSDAKSGKETMIFLQPNGTFEAVRK